MKKLLIISFLIVMLSSVGCNATVKNDQRANQTAPTPKYSEKIMKAIEEINKGGYEGYGGAMIALNIPLNESQADKTSIEYQLYKYAEAMNIMEYPLNDWPLDQRIGPARECINKISDSYDGPFADKIRLLKRYIANGKPEIGMNMNELFLACGAPEEANKTTTSAGTSWQFIFSKDTYDDMYVYLENGVVETIQE